MSPAVIKLVGTGLALVIALLGKYDVVPVDSELTSSIATLIFGWLNLPQPKKTDAASQA
jgi:hypothetical protein